MAAVTKVKSTRSSKEILQEKRAAVEAAIRKKRESERKALAIVEHMVENLTVDHQWLIDNAKFINPSYYQDAIEERAISKQCGFPLCSKHLEKVWKQQFCIDLKSKKVFDVTQRKNFCSDVCFSSSNKFKEQLLSSPLWMRNKEKIPQFQISDAPAKGLRGDEVAITAIALPDEDSSEEEEVETVKETSVKPKIISRKEPSVQPAPDPNQLVLSRFRQWFTPKSLNWLRKIEKPSQEDTKSVEDRLHKINLDTSEGDAKHLPAKLKPELKRDDRYLQVKAFLSGQLEYVIEDDDDKDTVITAPVNENTEDETISIVMPLANTSAQKALRKKIVMDYVEKWFPRLTTMTGLEFRRCQRDLNELVSTFNLTPDTVTFRPSEVPLLCLLLAFMLSTRDPAIKAKLTQESVQVEISKLLVPYEQRREHLEKFIVELSESLDDHQSITG